MVVPALDDIGRDLNMKSSWEKQMLMSIFILGWGLGPIVLGPLSEIFGRVVLLNTGHVSFIIANALCGLPRHKATFIALRFLAGILGSGPLSVSDHVQDIQYISS
jgi:MFS family permease